MGSRSLHFSVLALLKLLETGTNFVSDQHLTIFFHEKKTLCVFSGLSLTAMWTCIAHAGYLVVCAVLLSFLRCPAFSRAMLLLSVPLNAVAEVNQQPALDLGSLSLLLLTLSLGTKPRSPR